MAAHLSMEQLGIAEARELTTLENGDPPVGLNDVGINTMSEISISPAATVGMNFNI